MTDHVAQTVVQLMSQVERRPAHEIAVEDADGTRRISIARADDRVEPPGQRFHRPGAQPR